MCDHEQIYIFHVHSQRVQVQKYTARRLFSAHVQMSRVEGGESTTGTKSWGLLSLFIGTERAKRSTVQKGEREGERGRESGHLVLGVIFSRSWIPSLSIKRTVKEGRFRMKRFLSCTKTKKNLGLNVRRAKETAEQQLTSSMHIFSRSNASSLLRSATTSAPGEQVLESGWAGL